MGFNAENEGINYLTVMQALKGKSLNQEEIKTLFRNILLPYSVECTKHSGVTAWKMLLGLQINYNQRGQGNHEVEHF